MKRIACWTMMGAKNNIKDRPNSYEIFGIDYMVDTNFNTWLIEVNKNPALEYSTVIINSILEFINYLLRPQPKGFHDNYNVILLI